MSARYFDKRYFEGPMLLLMDSKNIFGFRICGESKAPVALNLLVEIVDRHPQKTEVSSGKIFSSTYYVTPFFTFL
jgi:hypothetical protein